MSDLPLAALLCRRTVPAGVLARLPDLGRAQIELAARHGVLGRVLATIERHDGFARLPGALAEPLGQTLTGLRRRGAFFAIQRDAVVERLRRGGVEPVVLKGGAVADLYFDDPAERQTADLDILVDPRELDRSVALLGEAGYRIAPETLERYRRFHFHFALAQPNGHIVEVHWALSRATQPFQLDAARVRAASVERAPATGRTVRAPRPEHLILHVVLQNLQEGFSRLSRFVDLDVILAAEPELDTTLLFETARSGGLGAALALSLRLTRRILGGDLPRGCTPEVVATRAVRAHLALLRPVRSLIEQRFVEHHAGYDLLRLWLTPGAGARLGAWLRLLSAASADPLRRSADGWSTRAARWLKVTAYQTQLYAVAPGRPAFWER